LTERAAVPGRKTCRVSRGDLAGLHLVSPLSPPPLSAPAGAERGAQTWLLRAGYVFSTREVAVRFFWLGLVNRLSWQPRGYRHAASGRAAPPANPIGVTGRCTRQRACQTPPKYKVRSTRFVAAQASSRARPRAAPAPAGGAPTRARSLRLVAHPSEREGTHRDAPRRRSVARHLTLPAFPGSHN